MLPAAGSAAANSAVLSVLAGSVRALASSAQASVIRRLLLQTTQPQPAAVALLQRAAQQSTRNPLAVAQVRTLATYQQQRHRLWLSSCSGGAGISTGGSSATNGSSWWQFPAVSMAVLPALGLQLTASSISRGYVTTGPAADDASSAEEEAPRRRRRSATESKAALRRTTESRAAIEDVAVMSRSQLMRRNKPWLAEQCWQHGLSHEGLKEDLIQRLLAWQGTEPGQTAAAAAHAEAAAARAAVAAATAAAAAPIKAAPAAAARAAAAAPAPADSNQHAQAAVPPASAGSATKQGAVLPAATAAPAASSSAAAAAAVDAVERPQLARPAACAVAVALPAEDPEADESTSPADNAAVTGGSSSSSSRVPGGSAAAAAGAQGASVGWHAPRSAASAAAETMGLFLGQLQEQPGNAALVAAARNAVEQYTNQLLGSAGSSSSSSSNTQQLVSELAATVSSHSSPQSLAALAKACYSREIQNHVLAASLAQAVAAVAAQLGPQEVYGVLRLLVEHLSEADDQVGFRTMDKGFRVLAEAMIRCSEALKPVQLAEAVELLRVHGYDDAFGLWMIAKEAAARLTEFDPVKEGGSVVQLLNAIAGMCVADDSMTSDVAVAVGLRKGEYSQGQLTAIAAALQRMGCTVEL